MKLIKLVKQDLILLILYWLKVMQHVKHKRPVILVQPSKPLMLGPFIIYGLLKIKSAVESNQKAVEKVLAQEVILGLLRALLQKVLVRCRMD